MQRIQDPRQSHVDNLNDVRHDLVDIEGTKRRNIWKLKMRNLKQRVRSKISWTCAEAPVTLRKVTSLVVKDEKGDLVADSQSILMRSISLSY